MGIEYQPDSLQDNLTTMSLSVPKSHKKMNSTENKY